MKIALASEPVKNGDIDFNLRSITDCMKKCSKKAEYGQNMGNCRQL